MRLGWHGGNSTLPARLRGWENGAREARVTMYLIHLRRRDCSICTIFIREGAVVCSPITPTPLNRFASLPRVQYHNHICAELMGAVRLHAALHVCCTALRPADVTGTHAPSTTHHGQPIISLEPHPPDLISAGPIRPMVGWPFRAD